MRENNRHHRSRAGATAGMGVLLALSLAATTFGATYGPWGTPAKIDTINGNHADLNTTSVDGCPIQSPDGLSLYMASTRPRFAGDTRTDLDIWVAHRASPDAPYGAPVNLADINTTADDFCPTPVQGKGLFFVSSRAGGCGVHPTGDIYLTRLNPSHGWSAPANLGCQANGGPNTAAGEAGPSYFDSGGQAYLYFSSGPDIVVSTRQPNGSFGPGVAVASLNSASNDLRPNVRKDGLEIVFDSDRAGGAGGFDIYTATRASVTDPWSGVTNVAAINTGASETRASFSWDALTLVFGRNPGGEGATDIFVTTR